LPRASSPLARSVHAEDEESDMKGEGVVDAVIVLFMHAVKGFFHAFAWPTSLFVTYKSQKIASLTFKCIVLNGVIFAGSIVLFHMAIMPFLRFLIDFPLHYFGNKPDLIDQNDQQQQQQKQPWEPFMDYFVELFLFAVYHIFWVYPVYTLSFVLNSLWYQEIADEAYLIQIGKPASIKPTYDVFLKKVTDILYQALLFLVFLVEIFVISFIPLFGKPISFMFMCWLYAFYSFEYKWINKGWSLEKRLEFLETHWAYFAGFGFPVTVITFYFPQFINSGIFALLFPMYVLMANEADPLPKIVLSESQIFGSFIPTRMPIFNISKKITSSLIKTFQRHSVKRK